MDAGEYAITTDLSRLDLGAIHGFLKDSYWARGVPRRWSNARSRTRCCFGLYRGDEQAGFARVTTDRATFAYLADVFVLEEHRGRGLGKWLMGGALAPPGLEALVLMLADLRGSTKIRLPRARKPGDLHGEEGRNLRRLSGPGLPSAVPHRRSPGKEEKGGGKADGTPRGAGGRAPARADAGGAGRDGRRTRGPWWGATEAFLQRRIGSGRHFTSVAEADGPRDAPTNYLSVDAALPSLPIPSLRQPNWKEIPCLHQWSTSRCPSMGTSRVRRRTRQPRRRRLRAAARVVRHSGRGVFRPSGPAGQLIDEVNGSGALLTGRRTAEQADHWGGDIHGAPIFVMSHARLAHRWPTTLW